MAADVGVVSGVFAVEGGAVVVVVVTVVMVVVVVLVVDGFVVVVVVLVVVVEGRVVLVVVVGVVVVVDGLVVLVVVAVVVVVVDVDVVVVVVVEPVEDATVQARTAGERSRLPEASVAATANSCAPAASTGVTNGDSHGAAGAPSSEQSNVEDGSLERNSKRPEIAVVVPDGPLVIDVSGGVASVRADDAQLRVIGPSAWKYSSKNESTATMYSTPATAWKVMRDAVPSPAASSLPSTGSNGSSARGSGDHVYAPSSVSTALPTVSNV